MVFSDLLKLMIHKKAADLFITAGVPPSLKIDGKATHVTKQALSPEQSRAFAYGVMTEEQRRQFEASNECNFSIHPTEIGRLRAIEDPIEYVHEHKNCIVTQREVGVDTESFDIALKNSLRQAPDVILIGEIRSRETRDYAGGCAETGH